LNASIRNKEKQISELKAHSDLTQTLTESNSTSGIIGLTPEAAARREAYSLEWLGVVAKHRGQYDRSEAYYRKALEIRKKLGDEEDAAFTLDLLLNVAKVRKNYARAREYGLKALVMHKRMGYSEGERRVAETLHEILELEHATRTTAEPLTQ
jgi:tetratricopeptide (TPR) repeat protein